MTGKQRKMLIRIIISSVLFAAAGLLPISDIGRLVLYLGSYAVIGWDILWKAVCGLVHGRALDENFLMALETVGAFGTG